MKHPPTPILIEPPTHAKISKNTRNNRICFKLHLFFLLLSGVLVIPLLLDRSNAFTTPINIQIDSLSVSSSNLSVSSSPNRPSSITARWNVGFRARNPNWKVTKSLDKVEIALLYHEGSLLVGEAIVLLVLRARQVTSAWVDLNTTRDVEGLVLASFVVDRAHEKVFTVGVSIKTVEKCYYESFLCEELRVVFNDSYGFSYGFGPSHCKLDSSW